MSQYQLDKEPDGSYILNYIDGQWKQAILTKEQAELYLQGKLDLLSLDWE